MRVMQVHVAGDAVFVVVAVVVTLKLASSLTLYRILCVHQDELQVLCYHSEWDIVITRDILSFTYVSWAAKAGPFLPLADI